jgi:thioredoxin reductase
MSEPGVHRKFQLNGLLMHEGNHPIRRRARRSRKRERGNLRPIAARVRLVHRSEEFAGHASTLREVQQFADYGHLGLHTSALLSAAHGNGKLEAVILRSSRRLEHMVEAQALLPMIGLHVNLGSMERWGLEFNEKKIVVNSRIATRLPGVFAAGDIVRYPGKIKLMAPGFAEAAIAVKSAVE